MPLDSKRNGVSVLKPLFIFSLPRSGSTLLQRILGSSEKISTTSEPWILLPFLYTLKSNGAISEYWHSLMETAVRDFYNGFPCKKDDYISEIRKFVLNLYGKRSEPGSIYFLDKTPRYHIIIEDIISMFPDGKFIFLWRNPLAIVSSIINTWAKGRWKLSYHKIDVYQGLSSMIESFEKHRNNIHSLKYENLLIDPAFEVKQICEYLNIEFEQNMLTKFSKKDLLGHMGDRSGIDKYKNLSRLPIDSWQNTYNNMFRFIWAKRYLEWIGEYRLSVMGYEKNILMANLTSNKDNNFTIAVGDLVMVLFQEIYNKWKLLYKTRKKGTWYVYN